MRLRAATDLILACGCIDAILVAVRKRFALRPSYGGFCTLGWLGQARLRSREKGRAFCPTDRHAGEGIVAGPPPTAGALGEAALAPAEGVRKTGTLGTMEGILSATGDEG